GMIATGLNAFAFATNSTIRASFNATGGFSLFHKWVAYNNAAPGNGEIPMGDALGGVWTMNTITAGSNISVTNGSASITIATSATPTFTGVTISGIAEYADNAAAISGGLTTGRLYRTGDILKIVH